MRAISIYVEPSQTEYYVIAFARHADCCSLYDELGCRCFALFVGLPSIEYEVVAMDELDERMKKIRQGYGYEGEVLYFLDSDSNVIGLLKKKTIWYILCRATREKLRAAFTVRFFYRYLM